MPAKRKGAAPSKVSAGPSAAARDKTANINGAYHNHIVAVQTEIENHAKFEGIVQEEPGCISQAAFNLQGLVRAFDSGVEYRCSGNGFWLKKGCVEVAPVNPGKVESWRSQFYSTYPGPVMPADMNYTFVVGIGPGDDPIKDRGKLTLLSPREPWDAWLTKVHSRIAEGAPDEEIDMWRSQALNVNMEFVKILDPEDVKWNRITHREVIGIKFELLFRTPLERVFEIIAVWGDGDQSGMSAAALSCLWTEKVKHMSSQSDPMTDTLVTSALAVYRHVLADDDLLAALMEAEARWKKKIIFDSVYKLELLHKKAGGGNDAKDKIMWMIESTHDRYRANLMVAGEASVRQLSGKMPGGHNKGLLDVQLMRRDLHNLLLTKMLDSLAVCTDSLHLNTEITWYI